MPAPLKVAFLSLALCVGSACAYAKHAHTFLSAHVVEQHVDSTDTGEAFVPIGSILFHVPLRRSSDTVVVDTPMYRMIWQEKITRRGFVTLPVHGNIDFYQDGAWFVVLDAKGRKHKFSAIHIESLTH